jgi:hypothetical protein
LSFPTILSLDLVAFFFLSFFLSFFVDEATQQHLNRTRQNKRAANAPKKMEEWATSCFACDLHEELVLVLVLPLLLELLLDEAPSSSPETPYIVL